MSMVHDPIHYTQMKAMNQFIDLHFYLQYYYFQRIFFIYLSCEAAVVSLNIILVEHPP